MPRARANRQGRWLRGHFESVKECLESIVDIAAARDDCPRLLGPQDLDFKLGDQVDCLADKGSEREAVEWPKKRQVAVGCPIWRLEELSESV